MSGVLMSQRGASLRSRSARLVVGCFTLSVLVVGGGPFGLAGHRGPGVASAQLVPPSASPAASSTPVPPLQYTPGAPPPARKPGLAAPPSPSPMPALTAPSGPAQKPAPSAPSASSARPVLVAS